MSAEVPVPTEELQTSANPQSGLVRWIPIGQLVESPDNPRKHFPEDKQRELVHSMRQYGFREWNMIVARPHPGSDSDFEIAAGHRRYRAACEAGLPAVPVLVREMTDAEFFDVLTLDNSGREDLHPLDEADGFRAYLAQPGASVKALAAKIGQEPGYVYQRLKYSDLIPAAREAFWAGVAVDGGKAVQIARLHPAAQKIVLGWLANGNRYTELALRERIARDIHHDLSRVAFDVSVDCLVRGVPSCLKCDKRVGTAPELYPDIDDPNICTDKKCFDKKQAAAVEAKCRELGQDTRRVTLDYYPVPQGMMSPQNYRKLGPRDEPCETTSWAVVANGRGLGESFRICHGGAACKVHGEQPRRLLNEDEDEVEAARETPAEKRAREAGELARRVEVELHKRLPVECARKAAVPFGSRELRSILPALLNEGLVDLGRLADFAGISANDNEIEGKLSIWINTNPIDVLCRALVYLAICESSGDERVSAANWFVDTAKLRAKIAVELSPKPVKAAVKKKASVKRPAAKKAAAPAKAKAPKKAAKK